MRTQPLDALDTTPARAKIALSFENIAKTYDGGRTYAVRNLDLDVHDGEFISLLGPSGSGKTTTLMMLAGFEEPSQGRILCDGKAITHVPPYRRGLGVVFQSYALFPHMTVLQNVAFPLQARRVDRDAIAERVGRALAMVELTGLGDRRPAELSGGQQQRVAVARALVFEPRVVLMDEPLGALDKRLRDQMQIEIKALQRRLGLTVVYVTHDQVEALSMSDRIAVFNNGGVEQLASPSEIYCRPATAFVAGFVGENNFLTGTARARQGSTLHVDVKGGGMVATQTDDRLNPGDRAILAIRPEAIRFDDEGRGLPGTVTDVMLLGEQIRYTLRCSALGLAALVVKTTSQSSRPPASVGQDVRLSWGSDAVRAFADAG